MSFSFRHPELVEGSVQPVIPKSSTVIDRRYGRISAPIVCALLLTSCSRLTQVNLDKIHNDMTPDQVKAILGEPSYFSEQTDFLAGGGPTGSPEEKAFMIDDKARRAKPPLKTTYFYQNGSFDIEIDFQRDKVVGKKGIFK